MDTFRLLILCALVLLAQGHRYTPQGVSGGSCSDLPVDVHTAVKQRIEELKGGQEFSDQLNDLTASFKALNASLQQQGGQEFSNQLNDLTASFQALNASLQQQGGQEFSNQLNELTASFKALNASLQQQVSELSEDVRNIQTIVGNLDPGSTNTATPSTASQATTVQDPVTPVSTTTPTTAPTSAVTNSTSRGSFLNPASSCKEIPPNSPSGVYWIQNNKTGSPVQAYCDMTRACCGITGGWMRVANLNMTDPSQNCPDGFNLVNRTTPPLRTCGRPGPPSCVSTVLSVHEPTYSHVCGRIIGYQYGGAKGFIYAHTILTFYLTGVSLTYNNLQHIWSFAAARDEETHDVNNICPCIQPKLTHTGTVQSFVGQDYFCDTGSATAVNPGSPQFLRHGSTMGWSGMWG